MEPIIKTYSVKVIREAGENPLTGQYISYDEQAFNLEATSIRSAYSLSRSVCTLQFTGQLRRTFVNGEEYFDERF